MIGGEKNMNTVDEPIQKLTISVVSGKLMDKIGKIEELLGISVPMGADKNPPQDKLNEHINLVNEQVVRLERIIENLNLLG